MHLSEIKSTIKRLVRNCLDSCQLDLSGLYVQTRLILVEKVYT